MATGNWGVGKAAVAGQATKTGVSQVCVKMDVLWVDITKQVYEADWLRWVENNRALMGEIQLACDQAEGVVI
jgi:hypothetical protein